MKRVTVRIPEDVVRAYDEAAGNRSALMRRRLAEAVEDGELSDVPADVEALASAEAAKDRGRLNRKRGTFRERCHSFYADKWESGAVTPTDAEDMAESWRREATIYGAEYVAFLEAIVEYYRDEWSVHDRERGPFPTPGRFIAEAEPGSVDVPARLVETMADARDRGIDREDAIRRVSAFHPDARVQQAAAEVFGDE